MAPIQTEEVTEEIFRIRLNRPERLNALNRHVLTRIPELFEEANENGAEVIILEGAGEAWCAGMDIDEYNEAGLEFDLFQDLTRAALSFPGIVIGKLHGYAVGGGFEFTLSFDLRYARTDTTFLMTESEIGVPISNASTLLLPLTVGYGNAKEIVFTSREVSATEASEMGLVAEVLEEGALEDRVLEVAHDIVDNKSNLAVRLNKRGLNRSIEIERALEYERLLGIENEYHRDASIEY